MSSPESCVDDLVEIRNQIQNPHSPSELSLRAAFDQLLQGVKTISADAVTFTGKGKKTVAGRPNLVVASRSIRLGNIEAEKYGFIQNLDHFLLTNHLNFRLCPLGQIAGEVSLSTQDDYVEFIAFARERIHKTGEGVVAFITSHSYLDNPAFRGLRGDLLQTFDEIYAFDLPGDQNVSEIRLGVAILLAVKNKTQSDKAGNEEARVFHADLLGRQNAKVSALEKSDVSATGWQQVEPAPPTYCFIPQNTDLLEEYSEGWKVADIFSVNSLGFQAHRPPTAIAFDKEKLRQQVTEYLGKPPTESDWEKYASCCSYRPFDDRFVYLDKNATDRSRFQVTSHLLQPNLAFTFVRQTKSENWQHCFVSDKPAPAVFLEAKDGSAVFPLYLYPEQGTLSFDDDHRPNISPAFLEAFTESIGITDLKDENGWPNGITPEMIFHYIYAILHSPNYRARYAEYLKTDFPRVPLPDFSAFQNLRALGERLIALHLLDAKTASVLDEARHRFKGIGSREVEKVQYSEKARQVKINAGQWFENVPREVWEFRVGGHQVAEKWLKDRKDRVLSLDEISHYARVLIALAETIRVMREIDEAVGEFPMV